MWKHWIKDRGIIKTADDLGVTRQTIHNWLNGYSIPDRKKIKLIKLSGYRFTLSDFVDE